MVMMSPLIGLEGLGGAAPVGAELRDAMGYMTAMGRCFGCGRTFSFNPVRVPSFKGEPVCEGCMTLVNEKRKAAGLVPHPIMDGAYGAEEVA